MQASPMVLTTLAGLATGLGGVLAVLAPPGETTLAISAGFAGGVMLTASLADLLPEALAFYGGYLPPLACGGAVVLLLALGMLAAGLLGRLLPEEAELAQKYGRDTARTRALHTALVTGTALVLHNFPEGVLTLFAGTADPALGLRTALAIALHNIPEGLAVAVPFAYASNSRAKGALAALASGLAEPTGALLALVLLRGLFIPGFLTGTMVLAAGVMLWVALAQLLPTAMLSPCLPGAPGARGDHQPGELDTAGGRQPAARFSPCLPGILGAAKERQPGAPDTAGGCRPAARFSPCLPGILGAAGGCLLMLLGIAALP